MLFNDEGVVHTGDLFFNKLFPKIDLDAGGSVYAWVESLDKVLALSFDRVIPGHGPVTDRAGLNQFQAFLRQLGQIAREVADSGEGLEALLRTDKFTEAEGYELVKVVVPVGINRESALTTAWQEAMGQDR